MSEKEVMEQIENLIEAWELNEADLNQTDINAMKLLLEKNQQLKEEVKAVNKGLRKAFEKRKKWKNKYHKAKQKEKNLIKYLEDKKIERFKFLGISYDEHTDDDEILFVYQDILERVKSGKYE